MRKGLFITFEGPDGSGKTTVSKIVVEKLIQEGYPIVYSREPGGSKIAESIRDIILDKKNTGMDARCEALLYAASRRQHLKDIILPALNEGKHVICDRFIDSSLAYQGVGRGIGIDEVYALNQFAIESHMPDKTIFLNISPKTGLERIHDRANLDRLDLEKATFHDAVYQGYQTVIEKYKERMVVIDANQCVEDVVNDVYQALKGIFDDA